MEVNLPARIGQALGLLCLLALPLASGGYSGWGYQFGNVLLPLASALCLPSLRLPRIALAAVALFLLSAVFVLTPLLQPTSAGHGLWYNALALVAAWIVTRSLLLDNADFARWLLPTLTVAAVLTALAGLFPYWGHWLNAGDFDYMVVSTFGLHNAYAGYLLLAWPVAVLAALQSRGSVRWLYGAAALLLVVTLVLTRSRAAAFVLLLQLAICAVAMLQSRLRWGRVPTSLAALLLVGAPIVAGALFLRGNFDYSLLGRLRFWDASLRMALDHPLGVGLGGFRYAYPQYQLDWKYYSVDPHSWPLQLLAELGILGGLLALALSVGYVLWARRAVIALGPVLGWLAVSAVGGSLLHAAFDFDYSFAATTALIGVLLAYGSTRHTPSDSVAAGVLAPAAPALRPVRMVAALWLLALCGWGQLLTLERFVLDELRAARLADPRLPPSRQIDLLRQAVSLMPRDEAVHQELAGLLAMVGRTAEARDHALRARGLAPRNATAHALVGGLQSDPQQRGRSLETAIELDPYNHPEFYYAWAQAAQSPEDRYARLKLGLERIPMAAPIEPDHIRYPDWHQFNPLWARWWNQLAQLEADPAKKREYAATAQRFAEHLAGQREAAQRESGDGQPAPDAPAVP